MENKEKEFAAEYSSALLELKVNSRPLIMMLTDLAKENEIYAKIVAEVIIHYIYKRSYKLPALYLVDSIVKNVGMPYKRLFASSIDKVFPHVFEKVDEEGRRKLYKLRQTWNDVFPHSRLCYLDTKVHGIDPAWPVPPVPKTTSPNHQFKRQKIYIAPWKAKEICSSTLLNATSTDNSRDEKVPIFSTPPQDSRLKPDLKGKESEKINPKKKDSTGTDCLRDQNASTLRTPPQDPRLNPDLKRKSLEKNHPKKKVKLSSESSDKPLITSESSEFKSQPVEKTVAVNENLSQKTSHHIKATSSENKKHYEVFGLFGKEDIDLRQVQTTHQLPHSKEVTSPNSVLCLAPASQTRDKTASLSIDAREKEVSNTSWKENINPIASKDMKNPLSLVEATQTREKSNFVIDTIENEISYTQEKEKINSDASRDLKNSVLYSVQASQCEDKNSSMVIDTKENEASYTPWKEKTPVASKYMKNSMLSQIEDKTSPVVIDTSRKVVSCTLWKENISPVDHRDIKAFNPYIGFQREEGNRRLSTYSRRNYSFGNIAAKWEKFRERKTQFREYKQSSNTSGSRYSDPGGSSGKDSWRREKIDHSYVNKKYSDHESVYTGSWQRSSYNNHSPNQEMNSPNYCNRNISKSGNVKYNGIELPSVSDKLLNIIRCEPQTKTIDIDGKPREIRVYGERAIILMDWDKPYTVSFESIQCNIIFDNGEYVFPIQIGEDYRVFFVNGENHRIKVGVPTHELMLDGKGYQCFFGNKPITVHFAGKHRTIGLDCRTPRVLFGRNINTEFLLGYVELTVDSKKVARLYLDAKPQVFMLEEKPYIIKFISAFQKVNINGAKFSVEFGGFPICILVEGARKYLRFSNLPSFVIPGITKVQGMDNEDLPDLPGPNYDSNTLSHGRVNRVPDYPSIPTCPPQSPSIVINNNSKPAQIPQAAPPVVNINAVFNIPPPTITADIPHQNVTPVNLNSSVNANSSFNTFPQKSEPSLTQKDISQHILPVLPLAHPSNTSIISGAYVSSLEFPSNLQHPPPMQSVITDNYQRPPLFPYPPPPLPSKVVTPFKEPTPPPTNPEDVHDLVNRLVKSGVIKNIKKVGKNKENEIKNNYKKKEDTMKNDSREIPNRLNFIDDIPVDSMMKVENLKRPNDKMKNSLYQGEQCLMCGERYFDEELHNQGSSFKNSKNREFYPHMRDFLLQMMKDEDEKDVTSEVDKQTSASDSSCEKKKKDYIPSVEVSDDPNHNVCFICHEAFKQIKVCGVLYYEEAVQVEGINYHSRCHQDHLKKIEEKGNLDVVKEKQLEKRESKVCENDGEEESCGGMIEEQEKEIKNDIESKDGKNGNEHISETEKEKFESMELGTTLETEKSRTEPKESYLVESLEKKSPSRNSSIKNNDLPFHIKEEPDNGIRVITSHENSMLLSDIPIKIEIDDDYDNEETLIEVMDVNDDTRDEFIEYPSASWTPSISPTVAETDIVSSIDGNSELIPSPENLNMPPTTRLKIAFSLSSKTDVHSVNDISENISSSEDDDQISNGIVNSLENVNEAKSNISNLDTCDDLKDDGNQEGDGISPIDDCNLDFALTGTEIVNQPLVTRGIETSSLCSIM
ncbi:UNVERIFIED_CONTAM: hypothetical protein RMT77_013346 [Armadillidium vulgare]